MSDRIRSLTSLARFASAMCTSTSVSSGVGSKEFKHRSSSAFIKGSSDFSLTGMGVGGLLVPSGSRCVPSGGFAAVLMAAAAAAAAAPGEGGVGMGLGLAGRPSRSRAWNRGTLVAGGGICTGGAGTTAAPAAGVVVACGPGGGLVSGSR